MKGGDALIRIALFMMTFLTLLMVFSGWMGGQIIISNQNPVPVGVAPDTASFFYSFVS